MIANQIENIAVKKFRQNKVMTISQIVAVLNCSIPTVRNRLKKWRTYTSYNQNGRYYVFSDIPKFDTNGLWKHKDIFFSKYGNLWKTVTVLVNNSNNGLNASEISTLLGLQARSLMSYLKNIPQLHREKINNRFIYFSKVHSAYIKQKRVKKAEEKSLQLPSDSDAVLILVDVIKHPQTSIEACTQRLKNKNIHIPTKVIRNLFKHYNIEKKTPDTL